LEKPIEMSPIVFLHGYPLNRTIWRHQERLEGLDVITPDFPGFGQTPLISIDSMDDYADWAIREIESRGHRRAIWVGHSMGGYVALAMARRRADRMAALVLVCTQARADTEDVRLNRLNGADRALREGVAFIAESMAPKLVSPDADPSLIKDIGQIISSASPDAVAQAQRAMASRRDQRDFLSSITMPVLICYGRNDQLFDSNRASEMADVIPGARLEEFPSSGHMAMMEEPQRFNRVLTDFIQSLPFRD
jgi:pimeloyl-ACP methyl ester carboxylesterase